MIKSIVGTVMLGHQAAAVMMGIGALYGAPVGAVLARMGKKQQRHLEWDDDLRAGAGPSPKNFTQGTVRAEWNTR